MCETGRRYSALNFDQAPWPEIKDELSRNTWDKMKELAKSSPTEALSEFHDKGLEILERLVPKKKAQRKFKSASSIHVGHRETAVT